MAKQNNQVARGLKQFGVKEPDPSSLNVRELRHSSVNEELHMPSIRHPSPGPIHVHGAIKIQKLMALASHYL